MKKEKSCGAVVFNGDMFLLVQAKHTNSWGFPKGRVEQGENEEQTALREICEEVGIKVELLPGFREEIKYVPRKGHRKTVVFFVGKSNSMDMLIDPEEVQRYKWLSYEQALMQLTFENTREVLKKAREFLN